MAESIRTPRLLAFGEILWDVIGPREFIGGAPFNFAAHAVKCGLAADLYSRIGRDSRGDRARAALASHRVGSDWLQLDSERPTGWVDVELENGQPRYTIGPDAAWDRIAAPDNAAAASLRAAGFQALVCGTLAQRSVANRQALRALRPCLRDVPVFYDVNLRPPHTPLELVQETLPGVTWLKVNVDEAQNLAHALWKTTLSERDFVSRVQREYGVKLVIITRGADGASVLTSDDVVEVRGIPTQLASAVGAGDAFAAAFLAATLTGKSIADALERANRLGSWVASQPGAVPDYPADLLGPT